MKLKDSYLEERSLKSDVLKVLKDEGIEWIEDDFKEYNNGTFLDMTIYDENLNKEDLKRLKKKLKQYKISIESYDEGELTLSK